MSSALAIASITYVLKDLLNDGLINNDVSYATSGNVTVTALPPDMMLLEATADKKTGLNLFMYYASPNQGWKNVDLPSCNSRGDRISNPPLALDLHYLLTAYAAEELHSEILLGYGMQLLHENPVLSRKKINRSLEAVSVSGSGLPDKLKSLAGSELADQVELIKISLQPMGTDEMSKLWSAFQSKYRPTAAYLVSVVLIESKNPSRSPLPVLTRGRLHDSTGRDEGIKVQPSLTPSYPTITGITPENHQPSIRLGETLTITGHNLDGDNLTILCANSKLDNPTRAIVKKSSTTEVTAQIPDESENWPAGVYSLSILVEQSGDDVRSTNALPFLLAPTCIPPEKNNGKENPKATRDDNGNVTVVVKCKPHVLTSQKVTLVLGDREFWADHRSSSTDTLSFSVGDFPAETYYCRLRIDGVESILIDRSKTPPAFDVTQRVAIT